MQIYVCGGAVRDTLLGRPIKDIDYVVVGATPDDMLSQGFNQVGADFPVFLDRDGNEYALARTERKTGSGYNGFSTDHDTTVTLEEDLYRRDLTINAMAIPLEHFSSLSIDNTKHITDPYNGMRDLEDETLRHVSPHFVEDPVRVLRIARFAARYDFIIADDTKRLLSEMVDGGELEHLVPERVWSEFERAMCEEIPYKFIEVLNECGAVKVLFPEIDQLCELLEDQLSVIPRAIPLETRVALLLSYNSPPECDRLLSRMKAPAYVRRIAHNISKALPMLQWWRPTDAREAMDIINVLQTQQNSDIISHLTMVGVMLDSTLCQKIEKIVKLVSPVNRIGFRDLTKEQQRMLKGRDIGIAINHRRLLEIQKLL